MRKFSLILAILMLIMATVVFADSTKSSVANTEKGLLESLGIIEGVIGNEITRADFAKYAAISAGTRVDLSSSDKSNFSDVVDNSNYAPYVKAMYNAGFMSGVGNGMFGSDLPISGVDAVVVLLRIAGFEQMAKYMGGYPSGYLAVAGQKGMLKGVDVSGEAIDGDSLVKLIYNTLHTDVYQSIGYGDLVEYKEIKGEDVLAVYHNVKKTEGVMTADRFTSLYDIKTACGKDEVEIDKVLYKYQNAEITNFLGMSVEAYYKSHDDGEGVIIYAYPDEMKNIFVTLSDDDIDNIIGNTVYYTEGGKQKSVTMELGFAYIYNGKADKKSSAKDILVTDSDIKLIDSDRNNVFETAIINHAETMIVTGVDREEYKIYAQNEKIVIFNESNKNNLLSVKDDNGNELYFDRIKQGDVISVYASKDNGCIKILVSTKTVEGTVIEKNREESNVALLIDDKKEIFEVAEGYIDDFEINLQGKFHVDVYGKIVYSYNKPGSDYTYGYLINGEFGSGLSEARLLILTSVDFEEYVLSKNVFVDGVKTSFNEKINNVLYSGGKFIPQVVRFYYTGKNEITYIDTTETVTGDETSDRLSFSKNVTGVYEETFPNFANACSIGEKTLFVKAPTNAEFIYDKDYYTTDYSFLRANSSYTISAYDMDEELTPKVIVYNSNEISVAGVLNDYSIHGVVMEQLTALSKDGEVSKAVKIFTRNGGEDIYFFKDSKYPVDKSMEFGDVILFVADTDNNIMKWTYDFDLSEGDVSSNVSSYNTYFTKYVGYPYLKNDKSFTFLNVKNNPDLEETWEHLLVFPKDVMKFIEVDMTRKKIEEISYSYVNSYKHYKNPKNKAFVKVYRGGGLYIDVMFLYKY